MAWQQRAAHRATPSSSRHRGGCSVSGSIVTFTAAGTCAITATQAGGGLYFAATPVSQSFTVVAATPQSVGTIVENQIASLVQTGAIASTAAGSLTAQVQGALDSYASGDTNSGSHKIGAFINHVQAMERSGHLAPAQAQALIDLANRVVTAGN